jgi:hypothetical protein
MLFAPLLMAADVPEAASGPLAFLPPGVLPLVFLGLAVLAVFLLFLLVVTERSRLRVSRQQLKVQILTHLQTSFPGVETDLELLPEQAENYKTMTPDARETAKSYLDFCAERFHWWRQGMIDPAIWSGWERGMSQDLKRPGLQVAWRERHARELTYTQAFKDWVNRKMSG